MRRTNKKTFVKKNILKVPKRAGVYALLNRSDRVLYVGKTKNLRRRLFEHLEYGDIPGAYYFRTYYRLSKSSEKYEDILIRKYRPKFNARPW